MDPATAFPLYDQISLPTFSIRIAVLILLVSLPLAALAGFTAGSSRRRRLPADKNASDLSMGETTLGGLLALLGLLLAFTFGNALSLSQDRKSLIIEEAAALGTAFLRADYLSEPGRTELQTAILDYTKTRIVPDTGSFASMEQAQAFLEESLQAQARLWPLTVELTADPLPPAMKSFIAGAMNDALDSHLHRTRVLSNPVSDVTQSMLLAVALTALFLIGYRSGMKGQPLSWQTFVFSGFLFLVMVVIVDTQRGNEGLIRVDDSALRSTVVDMERTLAGRA